MRRFHELVTEIRSRFPSDDFFANFEESCRTDRVKRRHYECYDRALMFLDASSWKILKKKAVDHYMNQRRGQRKQGFFNQLNEAFAYRYLCRRGFRRVRFIQEGAQKTPDIRFSDHGILKCCEVKTIGISDDEIKRRSSNSVFDGSNYISLNPEIRRKF